MDEENEHADEKIEFLADVKGNSNQKGINENNKT